MAAGTIALAGMAVSAASQGIAAGRARRMGRNISQDAQAAIAGMNVPNIVNPYAGVEDLSELAEDLSGQMYNPYSNIGVATQAAKIQAEEAGRHNQRRRDFCNLERDLRHLGGDLGDGEEDGEEQPEEDQGEDRLLHRGHPPGQLLDDLDAEKRPEDSGPSWTY